VRIRGRLAFLDAARDRNRPHSSCSGVLVPLASGAGLWRSYLSAVTPREATTNR